MIYASTNDPPAVTFIHPGGHEFNRAAPALIVKFFKEHPADGVPGYSMRNARDMMPVYSGSNFVSILRTPLPLRTRAMKTAYSYQQFSSIKHKKGDSTRRQIDGGLICRQFQQALQITEHLSSGSLIQPKVKFVWVAD